MIIEDMKYILKKWNEFSHQLHAQLTGSEYNMYVVYFIIIEIDW